MKRKIVECLVLLAVAFGLPSALSGQDVFQKLKNARRDIGQKFQTHFHKPKTGKDNAIERLAAEIDWLENYIDENGSLVVKQPDIWGESRLTKYRREVEAQLASRLGGFDLRDNASISRSDVSQLAAAISIGALSESSFAGFNQEMQDYQLERSQAQQVYKQQYEVYLKQLELYKDQLKEQTTNPTAPTFPSVTRPTPPTPPTFAMPEGFPKYGAEDMKALTKQPSGMSAASNLEPVIELNQLKRYLDHLNQLRRVNEGDDTSDAPGYALNLVRIPISVLPGRATRRGYGAEVTITAKPFKSHNLLPSTFRNLCVTDLVDQLSLAVVRLAESSDLNVALYVSRQGRISEELKRAIAELDHVKISNSEDLKRVIREIVNNATDAAGYSHCGFPTKLALVLRYVDELGQELKVAKKNEAAKSLADAYDLTKHLFSTEVGDVMVDAGFVDLAKYVRTTERSQNYSEFRTARQNASMETSLYDQYSGELGNAIVSDVTLRNVQPAARNQLVAIAGRALARRAMNSAERFDISSEFERSGLLAADGNERRQLADAILSKADSLALESDDRRLKAEATEQLQANEKDVETYKAFVASLQKVMNVIEAGLPDVSASRSRSSRFPISPAVTKEVFGYPQLLSIAMELRENYKGRHVVWDQSSTYDQIHLQDAKRMLRAYFDTAYEAIAEPVVRPILVEVIEGDQQYRPLADLITLGVVDEIRLVRSNFLDSMKRLKVDQRIADFCWCVVVEMAMLNKHLNKDVHEQAVMKGDCNCRTDCYHMYYLPMPKCSLEELKHVDPQFAAAADEFCNYVACRWPIHVFTIDPIHQEQNVSDASLVRRELSIAAALAFTSGKINLNQLTRFQRQFQEDISTVDLNRTQVGFMHSNDVFGWRFSPRIQTRKSQGNIRALGETMFGRGADANWREAVLEPGMRECTAIVLMPSFIPYCDFDTRTNWFQINKPTHTDVSMKETMKLSRAVTRMRDARTTCTQCEHLYRPGDLDRLQNRVEQLEREIPLQAVRAQIPHENMLGGFDLFNNGLTDLGPRLEGWYGAPGIVIGFNETDEDKKKRRAKRPEKTTLFLVAHNLSVNQTEVIAGGIKIENPLLISREVIQITVPDEAQLVEVDGRKYVAVYVATPYGPTNHMHIPVVTAGLEDASAKSIADLKKDLQAKISSTPYKWTTLKSVDVEIGYGDQNGQCQFGNASLIRKHDEFVIKSANLDAEIEDAAWNDLKHDDHRKFSIVGVIKSSDGKVTLGRPVLMASDQEFANQKLTIKSYELISSKVLTQIQKEIKSAMFKGENTLRLKIETYIVFVNDPAGVRTKLSNPIRIGEDITVDVIPNERCNRVIVVPGAGVPSTSTTSYRANPAYQSSLNPVGRADRMAPANEGPGGRQDLGSTLESSMTGSSRRVTPAQWNELQRRRGEERTRVGSRSLQQIDR